MSEPVENKPEPSTPEKLTPEQKVFHVKNNLRKTLAGFHNNLHSFIYGLPINEDQKKFALANLIQCLHWVEDAIEELQFEVTELPPVPEGAKDAIEEGVKQESNQPEHPQGSESGQAAETSGCDSAKKSGQEQKGEEVTNPT